MKYVAMLLVSVCLLNAGIVQGELTELSVPDYSQRPIMPYIYGKNYDHRLFSLSRPDDQSGHFRFGYAFKGKGSITLRENHKLDGKVSSATITLSQDVPAPTVSLEILFQLPDKKWQVFRTGALEWRGDREFVFSFSNPATGIRFIGYCIKNSSDAPFRGDIVFRGLEYQAELSDAEAIELVVPQSGYCFGNVLSFVLHKRKDLPADTQVDLILRNAAGKTVHQWESHPTAQADLQKTQLPSGLPAGQYSLEAKWSEHKLSHTLYLFPKKPSGAVLKRFGVQCHLSHRRHAGKWFLWLMSEMGFAGHRDELLWERFEQTPGNLELDDSMKQMLACANREGLEELTILGFAQPLYSPGRTPPSNSVAMELWGEYCTEAARVLKPYSTAFEVWNEPNIRDFWKPYPSAQDYAALLDVSYRAIKAGNPQAKVIAASTSHVDFAFISEMLKHLKGKKSFDAISVHPYSFISSAEKAGTPAKLDKLTSLLHKAGYKDVPIWLTEIGWSSPPGRPDYPNRDQVADWAVRAFTIFAGNPRLHRVHWYEFVDNCYFGPQNKEGHFGLIDSRFRPKPVAYALAWWMHMLDGANRVERITTTNRDIYAYRIVKDNAPDSVVLWTSIESGKFSVTAETDADTITDITGAARSISSKRGVVEISVGSSPKYLTRLEKFRILKSDSGRQNPSISVMPVIHKGNNRVACTLGNPSADRMNGRVELSIDGKPYSSSVIEILPGRSIVWYADGPFDSATPSKQYQYVCRYVSDDKTVDHADSGKINFWPVQRFSGQRIDNEWWARILPVDVPAANGAPGFVAKAAVVGDVLKLQIKVNDRIHHQPCKGTQIWQGDSVQIGLASQVMVDRKGRVEIGAALDMQDKIQKACWTYPELKFDADVKRVNDTCIYSISIPLDRLQKGFVQTLRLGVVVNNNDGKGRTINRLFDGIAGRKTARDYGYLMIGEMKGK